MSESDDSSSGRRIDFPPHGGVLDRPPELADPGRLFPASVTHLNIVPEEPEETTLELPPIPASPNPESALASTGIPLPELGEEDAEEEYSEYEQPRSLADRLGDWLEYRIDLGRGRMEGEAPFREAEIARKVALLEAKTAQETGLMDAQAKLRQAHAKANADRAGARGKADATRSKSGGSASGLGSDKGGRGKPGGGSGGSSGRGSGGGNGSGGGRSPKSNPQRSGAGKDTNAGKGRANGSTGTGKGGTAHRDAGGKAGGQKDGKGRDRQPGSRDGREQSSGRRERAAARQEARQQRRSAAHTAGLADRSKDRDQDRANRQTARERADKRADKRDKARRKQHRKDQAAAAEKKAAKKAADPERTSLGDALTEEAQRRWDKRRADQAGKKKADPPRPKVDLGKDKPDGAGKRPGTGTNGPDPAGPDAGSGAGTKSGRSAPRWRWQGQGGGRRHKRRGRNPRGAWGPFGPEPTGPTFEWDAAHSYPPRRPPGADGETDASDAETAPPQALPRAPEPRTQPSGTTRPTEQEEPVASQVSRPTTGQTGMPARHRTDITLGEYLVEMVNIAFGAELDKDRAQELAIALGQVADALRDMAADLAGDHNIATEVINQITDLADAAMRMKMLAERCATECETAYEAARIAATSVGRTYSEDIQAMDDAGLSQASAAAHHD